MDCDFMQVTQINSNKKMKSISEPQERIYVQKLIELTSS